MTIRHYVFWGGILALAGCFRAPLESDEAVGQMAMADGGPFDRAMPEMADMAEPRPDTGSDMMVVSEASLAACTELSGCAHACGADSACVESCRSMYDDEIVARFDSIQDCVERRRCGTVDIVDGACIEVECLREVRGCWGTSSGAGEETSRAVYQCLRECRGAGPCSVECMSRGSETTRENLRALYECRQRTGCAAFDLVCLQEACADQLTACGLEPMMPLPDGGPAMPLDGGGLPVDSGPASPVDMGPPPPVDAAVADAMAPAIVDFTPLAAPGCGSACGAFCPWLLSCATAVECGGDGNRNDNLMTKCLLACEFPGSTLGNQQIICGAADCEPLYQWAIATQNVMSWPINIFCAPGAPVCGRPHVSCE